MLAKQIIRRFRKEIRARQDIQDHVTIQLTNDPKRKGNVRAATILLQEIFSDRITIRQSDQGIICGSREEAAIQRIQAYTQNKKPDQTLLLASLPAQDIKEFVRIKTQEEVTIYIPESPEAKLVEELAKKYPEIRYAA